MFASLLDTRIFYVCSIRWQSEKEAFPMTLGVVELKAISALIVRARGLIEDALVIAEAGADIAVETKVKRCFSGERHAGRY